MSLVKKITSPLGVSHIWAPPIATNHRSAKVAKLFDHTLCGTTINNEKGGAPWVVGATVPIETVECETCKWAWRIREK